MGKQDPRYVWILLSRWPWPVQNGRQRMLAQMLRAVASVHHVRVFVWGQAEAEEHQQEYTSDLVAAGCGSAVVETFSLPRLGEVIWNILRRPQAPLQEALYRSRAAAERFAELARQSKPQVVIVDMVRLAHYAEQIGAPWICDMDDMLSIRYKQQAAVRQNSGSILGTRAKELRVPGIRMIETFLRVPLLLWESNAIFRRELKIARSADATVLVSGVEARLLRRLSKTDRPIVGIPPSCDPAEGPRGGYNRDGRVILLGDMRTQANRNSAMRLITRVMPRIWERRSATECLLIGNGTRELLHHFPVEERIVAKGFEDDLNNVLRDGDVMCAPMEFGTGVKTKIIDALAAGIPTVTTRGGARGIPWRKYGAPAVGGKDADMARIVVRFLSDKQFYVEARDNGYQLIYSWCAVEPVKAKYLAVISSLPKKKGRRISRNPLI